MSRMFADASLKLLLNGLNLKLNLLLSGEFGVFGLDSPESAILFEAHSLANEMARSRVSWFLGEIGRTVAIAKCFVCSRSSASPPKKFPSST